MAPLESVKLTALMERGSGSPDVKIGLIDGPVLTRHPDLAAERLREIGAVHGGACTTPAARPACTGRLWPASCRAGAAAPRPRSAPAAPC